MKIKIIKRLKFWFEMGHYYYQPFKAHNQEIVMCNFTIFKQADFALLKVIIFFKIFVIILWKLQKIIKKRKVNKKFLDTYQHFDEVSNFTPRTPLIGPVYKITTKFLYKNKTMTTIISNVNGTKKYEIFYYRSDL